MAVTWPLAAHAQQGERIRRIGVLSGVPADDPDTQAPYTVLAYLRLGVFFSPIAGRAFGRPR